MNALRILVAVGALAIWGIVGSCVELSGQELSGQWIPASGRSTWEQRALRGSAQVRVPEGWGVPGCVWPSLGLRIGQAHPF